MLMQAAKAWRTHEMLVLRSFNNDFRYFCKKCMTLDCEHIEATFADLIDLLDEYRDAFDRVAYHAEITE